MIFSSIYFTFFFLPILLGLYFISKSSYRNYILLIASLGFYAYGEPKFVSIMVLLIIANYIFAIIIDNNKNIVLKNMWMFLSIFINLGILFLYKYWDFTIKNINTICHTDIPIQNMTLPIGISFFTFQALSYIIDVYRGSTKAQKNPFFLALYIIFFPQLIAGPIIRYNSVVEQIKQRAISIEKFGYGTKRFICGFAKKVIIANNLSIVAEQVFSISDYTNVSALYLWIGTLCYSLQIFYDFSGYSDMAIGLGKMFGFDYEENFNYPYTARSITDFWRRWHISLSKWFRDYVYIPLGGSKKGAYRQIINLLVIWLLTGIWHGANFTFIIWGLIYFIFLILEKFIIKPVQRNWVLKIIWQICTLLIVNFQWVIFNSKSVKDAYYIILAMLGKNTSFFRENDAQICLVFREYGIFIFLGILFAMPIAKKISKMINTTGKTGIFLKSVSLPIGYIAIFFWAMSFLILGAHNPFIYFNF
ncbi:MAG: MBOAT family protein [Roseburia sp.]|nr:MBOAT family protein [Roseburia sp.]